MFTEPGQVADCCKGVPSGGGGDLVLIDSGVALKSVLCGAGLFLTASGTALTGGPSIFVSVSHSKATLASRFLERQKIRGSTNSHSQAEKTTSLTTFTFTSGKEQSQAQQEAT